jgi:regulator of sigma E protease
VTLLWFLLLVGPLVIVHELGHLVVARLLGVGVVSISFGMGRPLLRLRRGETEWSIRVLPVGGYVRLLGEDASEAVPEGRRRASFAERPAWQRLAIILGGPAANLLLAVPLFFTIYARHDHALASEIGSVFAGMPAAEADLRPGDRVTAVDGDLVRYWEELNQRVLLSPGRELKLTIERAGSERALEKYVRPREHLSPGAAAGEAPVGLIGIAPHRRLPQVGVLSETSPAALAGMRSFDVVLAIQGRPAQSLADLEPLVNPRSGNLVVVSYVRATQGLGFAAVGRLEPQVATIVPVAEPRAPRERPVESDARAASDRALVERARGRYDAGVRPADLFVYDVEAATQAATLGLRRGDLLVRLDDAPLASWELFERALEERPRAEHEIAWYRPSTDAMLRGRFTLGGDDRRDGTPRAVRFGAVGAQALEPGHVIAVDRRLPRALGRALERTASISALIARTLLGLLVGRVPASALGGPIRLVEAAGEAAREGGDPFLAMAALVSLNLGLINLLPLPLLDGGQGAVVVFERLAGRPLSDRARRRATLIGLVLLVGLLLLACWNDLRLILGRSS